MSAPSPYSNYRGDTTLGVGQIISEAFNTSIKTYFGIFFLNLPILIATVAAFGASFLSAFSQDRSAMQEMIEQNMGRFFFLESLIFIFWLVSSCAMTRLVHDRYIGSPQSGGASAVAGAKRSLPALGLLLIFIVAYIVFALVLALVVGLLQLIFGAFTLVLALGLTIFGLYLAFPYLLAGIVCINEEMGPIASLGRSKYLTSLYRWPLLGMILVAGLIIAAYQVVFLGISYLLAPTAYGQTLLLVATALLSPLLGGWMIGLFVIAAHRLRVMKDGLMSSPALSDVFE